MNDLVPFDANDNVTTDFDGKNFKLSIHLSGGVFKRKRIRNISTAINQNVRKENNVFFCLCFQSRN